MNNIVLCGFMGCGKTSIGKKLARKLNMEFCDIDRYIEKQEKMKVQEIFAKRGEPAFRALETGAVRAVAKKRNTVVACGGGTVLNKANSDIFRQCGDTVLFLDVPLAALQERLKNDKKRPLLQVPDRQEVIRNLYNERISSYKKASDMIVPAGAPTVTVVNRICEKLKLK